MISKREEIWQPQTVRHLQWVWKYHALLFHKGTAFTNHFSSSLSLLSVFILMAFYLFFFSSGTSEIWPHLETVPNLMLSTALPIRSNYSCRGSTEKCQLAIKVPQTSIMSSSYKSLGAAQNWTIISTVKNSCWGPPHSLFPLIIAWCWCWSHGMYTVEPWQLQGIYIKNNYSFHPIYGEETWHWVPLCLY